MFRPVRKKANEIGVGEAKKLLHEARRGVLAEAVDWALTRLPHLRADTHEANVTMQRCLERAGFVRCGVIHVADGTPRLAYEKI